MQTSTDGTGKVASKVGERLDDGPNVFDRRNYQREKNAAADRSKCFSTRESTNYFFSAPLTDCGVLRSDGTWSLEGCTEKVLTAMRRQLSKRCVDYLSSANALQ